MAASLSLPDHQLTGSHSTCTLYHPLCVFNYPSFTLSHPLFSLSSSPAPLKYLPLIFAPLPLSLSSPLDLNFSVSSSLPLSPSSPVVVSLRGAVLLLTVCYREQREGEGKPVGDGRALLSTQVLVHCKIFERCLCHIL